MNKLKGNRRRLGNFIGGWLFIGGAILFWLLPKGIVRAGGEGIIGSILFLVGLYSMWMAFYGSDNDNDQFTRGAN